MEDNNEKISFNETAIAPAAHVETQKEGPTTPPEVTPAEPAAVQEEQKPVEHTDPESTAGLAEELAPGAEKKGEGTDELLEAFREEGSSDDEESDDYSEIDMDVNQVLVGPADSNSLIEAFRKQFKTNDALHAAYKDKKSIINRTLAARGRGWGTSNSGEYMQVLKEHEAHKGLKPQKESDTFQDGNPSRINQTSSELSGQTAILAMKSRLGGITRVCLLNSGFWVVLRSPNLGELQEVFASIDTENREIGRMLGGHFALISDLYLKKKFIDILVQKKLIFESNFKDWHKPGAFARNLSYHDYETLIHGMVMLMTRGGLRYRCVCPQCGQEAIEKLDVGACKFINENLVTPEVKAWWRERKDKDGKLLYRTETDLARYRNQILNRKRVYKQTINNGTEDVKVEIEFREPTFDKFYDVGVKLIELLTDTIDNISKGEEDRAAVVQKSLQIHGFQLLAPWVYEIRFLREDGSVEISTTDPDAILEHLDMAAPDDIELFNELTTFLSETKFNYIGTHAIKCPNPKCGAVPSKTMDGFFPLEVQTIFFALLSRLWLVGR